MGAWVKMPPLLKSPQTKEELEQIVALDLLCLGGFWSLQSYQKEVENPNSVLLTLVEANMTIGCGCFWSILEEAHITMLAIHPDYQGQGLGSLLLFSLLKNAHLRGLERATLEVRTSNFKAISLYQKFKFKIAGTRKKYYENGEDALIFWRGDLAKTKFNQTLN